MITEVLIGLGILALLKKPTPNLKQGTPERDSDWINPATLPLDWIDPATLPQIAGESDWINPATKRIAGNLLSLANQAVTGTGVFGVWNQSTMLGVDSIMAIDVIGPMMAGQGTFTNPYSGYVGMIPGVGQFLGGLLEGILKKGDPMAGDPVDPAWLASLQRKNLDKRWAYSGCWKSGDAYTASGSYKFKRPTGERELAWYMRDWACFASQFISTSLPALEAGSSGFVEGGEVRIYQYPQTSVFGQWINILKARDAASGIVDVYNKFYNPGPFPAVMNADASVLSPYCGVNPFLGLEIEDMEFYFKPETGVLDKLDALLSVGGWYGFEGLPPGPGEIGYGVGYDFFGNPFGLNMPLNEFGGNKARFEN